MEHDLYQEIVECQWLMDKIRSRRSYAQNLYAAWCNMQWQKNELWPVLKDQLWSCSWRAAGACVAGWRKRGGDYMDYYCSGLGEIATYDLEEGRTYMREKKYVKEGVVTDEIRADLATLGWIPVPYTNEELS